MRILHPGIVVKAKSLGLLHKKTHVTVSLVLLSVLSGEIFQIEERKENILSLALPHFIALLFIVFCWYCLFFFKWQKTDWKFVVTMCWGSLLMPFSQQHLLPLCLCYILAIIAIFQTYSLLYLLRWSVISDVTIANRLQLTEGSDDG